MTKAASRHDIDRQHREVGDKLRRLLDLTGHADCRENAIDCLRELVVEIGSHFGLEEALMAEGGYPDHAHHFRQHLGLMNELGLLLDRLEDVENHDALRQVSFFVSWYEQHLELTDRKLIDWLASR